MRRVFGAANLSRPVSSPAASATSSETSRRVRTSTSSKGCDHGTFLIILVTHQLKSGKPFAVQLFIRKHQLNSYRLWDRKFRKFRDKSYLLSEPPIRITRKPHTTRMPTHFPNVLGDNPNRVKMISLYTDSRIDTQDRGFPPSFPGRFCSCRSVAVVHLKGTSEKRV
ncbi:hypothetical protein CSKR_104405 [Clonorchis sinensis]|uniref:Uncharacterized protein n=1 Tax=Clonorchis sinensis TaxID=79923 RepID=A0A3R7CA68_CLOSI|nr:hypothetical protein CSKR_104405 [Clonorchis sinensis]